MDVATVWRVKLSTEYERIQRAGANTNEAIPRIDWKIDVKLVARLAILSDHEIRVGLEPWIYSCLSVAIKQISI